MPPARKPTTILSTKGRVTLPKAIRQKRQWKPGTRLVVEDTSDGVLLRQAPHFPRTEPNEVFASLRFKGKPKTLHEMRTGVLAETKRHSASK